MATLLNNVGLQVWDYLYFSFSDDQATLLILSICVFVVGLNLSEIQILNGCLVKCHIVKSLHAYLKKQRHYTRHYLFKKWLLSSFALLFSSWCRPVFVPAKFFLANSFFSTKCLCACYRYVYFVVFVYLNSISEEGMTKHFLTVPKNII